MDDGLYYRGQPVQRKFPEAEPNQLMRYGRPVQPNLMQPVPDMQLMYRGQQVGLPPDQMPGMQPQASPMQSAGPQASPMMQAAQQPQAQQPQNQFQLQPQQARPQNNMGMIAKLLMGGV